MTARVIAPVGLDLAMLVPALVVTLTVTLEALAAVVVVGGLRISDAWC